MHLNFNIMRDQNFKPSTKFNLLASCMTLRNYLRGHKKIINPPFLHPLLVFNSPFRLYLAYRLAPSLSLAPPSKAVHVARSQSSASDAVQFCTYISNNVSEEPTSAIYCPDLGGSLFLLNVCTRVPNCTTSYLPLCTYMSQSRLMCNGGAVRTGSWQGNLKEKRPLGRPRHKREYNIKMGLQEIGRRRGMD